MRDVAGGVGDLHKCGVKVLGEALRKLNSIFEGVIIHYFKCVELSKDQILP